MRRVAFLCAAIAVGLVVPSQAAAQSVDELVAQAVRPLPTDLQAGATVFTYDANSGERIVLREGTNHVECQPRNAETGYTRCFSVHTAARRDLQQRLTNEGKSADEIQAALAEAEAAGRIAPVPFGSVRYRLYEQDDRIQYLWTISLPNAMAADLGMPTASQRDSSLAGQGRPWMMNEGTPGAHLMIPINGTALSNAGGARGRANTRAVDDPVAQAVLPLPEDLRDGATVVTYDADTGERRVLRQGTNSLVCWPRNPETGYTRCYHETVGPERDLEARLRAGGASDQDIDAAVAAARADGTIPGSVFGSLAYRLYEENDRLKLLWMLRVPGATAEQLGMPTGSQRDSSLAGQGTPWMMLEGTPGAHLMIPINKTELSN